MIGGYGLTMRLETYSDSFLSELVEYMNAEDFQSALRDKFEIVDPVTIETAIQKKPQAL